MALWPSLLIAQDTKPKIDISAGRRVVADLGRILNPNGIQENYQVKIGGINQWVYVRGQNRDNPIILFIHGGPASPLSPVMWMFQRPVEEYFTVVNYDQRGSGKTFLSVPEDAIRNTIKIDTYVDDAIELAAHIREKYHATKLILMGHSWGTIIGMKAALKRPDLFYAYVGIGQAINVMDNERISFEFGWTQAEKNRNDTALAEMRTIAPYPGKEPVTRERIITARKWAQYYGGLSAFRTESLYFYDGPLLSPEYDPKDIRGIDDGNVFSLGRILPEFLAVDFKPVKKFPIPVFMFMGRHDYTTPSEPTNAWLKAVSAPAKKGVWFENSSHMIPFEEPGKLLVELRNCLNPVVPRK